MDEIRWLSELTRDDVAIAGGKGANLGELVRDGFPVPDGFVVTTAAYDRFVTDAGVGEAIDAVVAAVTAARPAGSPEPAESVNSAESAESAAGRVAGLFAAGELPPALATGIRDAYERLGGGPVAVRSSATAEDLAEASFAGQQDTYLNVVGADALLIAVRDCWASLWSDRAIWYRAEHGDGSPDRSSRRAEPADPGPANPSLAVVVQKLVPADAAGVMFTANPANGRTEETVITAAWGLGEAVVSGLVDTDTIVVDTAADRVVSSVVADKTVRVDPAAERTAVSETSSDQRHAAVLDDAQALRLAALGARIEEHFGAPQDIEWVLADGGFGIVQSRPITALSERIGPVPDDWPVPAKGLYFRASITEQLPDPLTPLFAGLMATAVPLGLDRLLSELAPDREFGDVDFPTINGYAFYRYSYEAFRALLKSSPAAIKVVLDGGGAWIEDRWRRRLAEYRVEVNAEEAIDVASVPADDLLAALGRLVDAVAYYYTTVQTIIPLASMAELTWTGVYEKLLRRPGDPAADAYLLGFDSEPIRADKALWDLARWVREQPGLGGVVAGLDADLLATNPPPGVDPGVWDEWRERFGAHLAAHGHTLYNLDFVNPVPADDPAPLLQALRFDLADGAPDPYQRQSRAVAAREDATATLLVRLSGWRAERVRRLLAWTQHTGPLREDALAAMGLFLPPARRLLREFGRRLVASGAIGEPLDACWLTLAEARAAAASLDGGGPVSDLRERVAKRKEAARGQRLATPPQYLPKNRAMDAFEWMYPAKAGGAKGGVLTGTAGSGGVVTARARVLAGPQDFASFQPGEVLVASITTPAYTPLFAMAAGVVTDIGGVLSHGSIVAREYGIPAVLGTGSATRLIHTGDLLVVDGAAGKVTLPEAAESAESEPTRQSLVEPVETKRKWIVAAGAAALVAATVAHFWYHGRRRRP